MNRQDVDKMIKDANDKKQAYIRQTETVIRAILCKYFELHASDKNSEEYKSMAVVRTLLEEPDWHEKHDSVWNIFLELQHSLSIKYILQHANEQDILYRVDLQKLKRNLDPDAGCDPETAYPAKYLDSDKIPYDGDVLICDPFMLMDKASQQKCDSIMVHDTLTDGQACFCAKNKTGDIFGTVKITTGYISTVLMKDLWQININDILHRMNVWDYIYIRQFHGTIRFTITKEDTYRLCIIGEGNKPFVLDQYTGQP